jgi:hypothetical protein
MQNSTSRIGVLAINDTNAIYYSVRYGNTYSIIFKYAGKDIIYQFDKVGYNPVARPDYVLNKIRKHYKSQIVKS